MSRPRIKKYTDIVLSLREVRKIRKGYKVTHFVNGHHHCIYMEDNTLARKVSWYKKQISLLRKQQKGV